MGYGHSFTKICIRLNAPSLNLVFLYKLHQVKLMPKSRKAQLFVGL
jgi:hypothetical protein